MSKRNLHRSMVLMSCLVWLAVACGVASGQTVLVDPPTLGDECHVLDTIWINFDHQIVGVEAASFLLTFDQTIASFVDSLDTIIVPPDIEDNVYAAYELYSPDSMRIDVGVLHLHFSGPSPFVGIVLSTTPAIGMTELTIDRSILRNSNNDDIPHTVSGSTLIDVVCCCEFHGDVYDDPLHVPDALDLNYLIDYLFFNGPAPPQDSGCPHINRGDLNCDAIPDAVDLNILIGAAFFNGDICNPCDCSPYPDNCPWTDG